MRTPFFYLLIMLFLPLYHVHSQKVDSLKISPSSPLSSDSIHVMVYGVLTSGGVSITRVVNNADPVNKLILIDVFGRHCAGGFVVTPFVLEHTFPPMQIGELTVCCSTFQDTTSNPGPYGNCIVTDTFVPLWNLCETFQIVLGIAQHDNNNGLEILTNPIHDGWISLYSDSRNLGKNLNVTIFDITGRVCLTKYFTVLNIIEKIPLNISEAGIYIVKIIDSHSILLSEKIILLE